MSALTASTILHLQRSREERTNLPTARIIDFPVTYHNGAFGFSFYDGHSKIHKRRSFKIKAPVHYKTTISNSMAEAAIRGRTCNGWLRVPPCIADLSAETHGADF